MDAAGDIAGVAQVLIADPQDGRAPEAYIPRLAVRRDLRGRGALVSGLSTDSRTGALALYKKVGMRPTSVWLHRAVDLGT